MRLHPPSTTGTLLAVTAAAMALAGCSSGHRSPAARATPTAGSTTTSVGTTTTTAAATTTSTTDPASLPQTAQLPSASDPQFLKRMADLLQAISTGDPSLAAPAFFPVGAYVQVKGISDPVHDYQTRLIADYDQDIAALHTRYGSGAGALSLDHVSVPDAAEWIRPGVEYNKGSYWRVYGTRLWFRYGGALRDVSIASLISWRGQWYVVHLSSIR